MDKIEITEAEKKGFTFFDHGSTEKANEKLSCTMMGCVLVPVLGLGLLALFMILNVVFGLFRIATY
jgi:hypothetical protein